MVLDEWMIVHYSHFGVEEKIFEVHVSLHWWSKQLINVVETLNILDWFSHKLSFSWGAWSDASLILKICSGTDCSQLIWKLQTLLNSAMKIKKRYKPFRLSSFLYFASFWMLCLAVLALRYLEESSLRRYLWKHMARKKDTNKTEEALIHFTLRRSAAAMAEYL